jgi:hypothetical protein
MRTTTSVESSDIESVMHWFENGIQKGENGVLVYPNLQTFREIYSQYVKDQLAPREEQKGKKGDEDNDNDNNHYHNNAGRNEHLLVPRSFSSQPFMIQSTL